MKLSPFSVLHLFPYQSFICVLSCLKHIFIFIILEKQNGLKIVNTNFTFLIKVKCNIYWPDKDNPTFYGPVEVTLMDEKEYACFTTRKLSVLNKQVTLVLVYSTKEPCILINITCVCTIIHILYCIYSKLSCVY